MIPDKNSKNEKKKIITPLARGFNFFPPALRPAGTFEIKKATPPHIAELLQAHTNPPQTLCLQKNCNFPYSLLFLEMYYSKS